MATPPMLSRRAAVPAAPRLHQDPMVWITVVALGAVAVGLLAVALMAVMPYSVSPSVDHDIVPQVALGLAIAFFATLTVNVVVYTWRHLLPRR